jgi:uncharacterized damage-inducible protein DinB
MISDRRLEEAIRHFDPPAGTKLWYGGAGVLQALRGVHAEVAAWRPYPDRHSIWGLALHVAYWEYAVWRRLVGAPAGGFPRSPRNFPDVPGPASRDAWEEDRRLVREWHDRLAEAMRGFDPARLDEVDAPERSTTYADLISGIVMHDTYHAGQIKMLTRLAASAGVEGSGEG